jgi:hypothetical protein
MKIPKFNPKSIIHWCVVAWMVWMLGILTAPVSHAIGINLMGDTLFFWFSFALFWGMILLSIIAGATLMRKNKTTKHKPFNPRVIVLTTLFLYGLLLLTFVIPAFHISTFPLAPVLMTLAFPLTLASIGVLLVGYSNEPGKTDGQTKSPLAKALSLLLILCLVVSAWSAIASLGIDIWDRSRSKFIYENIATGAGFGAVALGFILSALQKDVYWVTRQKTLRLDERQLKERQQVFELSYKIGAILVLVGVLAFANYSHEIMRILANDGNTITALTNNKGAYVSLPFHFYWPLVDMAIALFVLPLVIASWKKR